MTSALRAFNRLTLTAQIGGACAAFTGLAAGAVYVWGQRDWRLVAVVAAAGLSAAMIAVLLASRTTRGLRTISASARQLSRDGAAHDQEMPLVDSSLDLVEATISLRRMVESARKRELALEARALALSNRLENRTHELTTLQDLSIGLAATSDMHELVDETLGALEQTLEYASASLWARSGPAAADQVVLLGYRTGGDVVPDAGGDLTGMPLSRSNMHRYEQIERAGAPVIENNARQSLLSWLWAMVTDDARSSALYQASRSWMAIPLKFRDQVMGVMRVDHQEPEYFDTERARLLTAVGSQTALAMRHSQLLTLEREVAVIAERNRIARDLHDAVSQTLFAANLIAGTLARTAGKEPPVSPAMLAAHAQSLEKLNRGALAEMRLLMFELRPDTLQATPLADLLQHAIEALTCRGEIVVAQSLARRDRCTPEVRLQVYRIAQEALSNISRHSGATRVVVEWSDGPGDFAVLRLEDNGNGFDPEQPAPGHFGLDNMRHRAAQIGARFRLASSPGTGTTITLEIPEGSHVVE